MSVQIIYIYTAYDMRIPDCEVKILFRPQFARRGIVVLCVYIYH